MLRVLFAVALAATLAACATVPPNPLNVQARQALFVKNVGIAWSYEDAKDSAKQAAYEGYKKDIQARLKDAVAAAFATSPAGGEAVTFKIDVKRFNLAVTGGTVVADVTVIRVSDGKALGVYTDVTGMQSPGGGGLLGVALQAMMKPDVVGMVSNSFAATLRGRFDAAK